MQARSVAVLDGPQVITRHERAVGKCAEILILGHYLAVLKIKPGVLPGATALAQVPSTEEIGVVQAAVGDANRGAAVLRARR